MSAAAVGAAVRIVQSDGTRRRATVSFINDGNTVDVIYDGARDYVELDGLTQLMAEESGVEVDRIEDLLDFERGGSELDELAIMARCELRKAWGAKLFQIKDYIAAAQEYDASLRELFGETGKGEISLGSAVLVKRDKIFRAALVSDDTEGKRAEVVFLDVANEEAVVDVDAMRPLPSKTLTTSIDLQWKLHLNVALCYNRIKAYTAAVERASMSLALAKWSRVDSACARASASDDVFAKALLSRSKSFLRLSRFRDAAKDAKKVMKLKGHSNSPVATQMLAAIDRRAKAAAKADRKLVKSMSSLLNKVARSEPTSKDKNGASSTSSCQR